MIEFAKLLGENVLTMSINDDSAGLRFKYGLPADAEYAKTIYIGTEGDCASETWFADIVGVTNLLQGGMVSAVEILQLPKPADNRSRQESDKAYGIRLRTDKGDCDFIYRNSSNGYYEGSVCQMADWKGVGTDWTPITEDYTA